jgi:hypothetical protein
MDVESANGPLDGQLNDVAISVGGEVAELSDDWTLSLVGGLGTANDGHWSNDDALYGLGTVNFSTELDEHSSLHLGIYFDGNQSLFPDVPLPQAAYLYRPSEDLWLTLGSPNTKIYYVPVERLSISFLYHFVAEVRAVVDYDLVAGFHLFGQYSRSIRSFTLEESNNRRLHYEVDRVASGVRWITDWIDVSMAIGYTLDHSYRVGWDLTRGGHLRRSQQRNLRVVHVAGRDLMAENQLLMVFTEGLIHGRGCHSIWRKYLPGSGSSVTV